MSLVFVSSSLSLSQERESARGGRLRFQSLERSRRRSASWRSGTARGVRRFGRTRPTCGPRPIRSESASLSRECVSSPPKGPRNCARCSLAPRALRVPTTTRSRSLFRAQSRLSTAACENALSFEIKKNREEFRFFFSSSNRSCELTTRELFDVCAAAAPAQSDLGF